MRRWMDRRALAFWFTLTGACAACIGLAAYWGTQRYSRALGGVEQAHRVLVQLEAVQTRLESGEAGALRYLLSGEVERLKPFLEARRDLPKTLRRIESEAPEDQKKTVRELNTLFLRHLSALGEAVDSRAAEGAEVSTGLALTAADAYPRVTVARYFDGLRRAQSQRVGRRSASAADQKRQTGVIILLLAGVGLGFFAWAFKLLRRASAEGHQAQQQTAQMQTFLSAIIERIPYRIIVKETRNLRITLVNQAAADWIGKPAADLVGSNAFDLWPRERAREEMRMDREAVVAGKPVDIPEERVQTPGKAEAFLHTQKFVIPGDEGDAALLVTIAEDITERKKAERMLELSRDAAVESARLKAEFLRNMSHEFRTPLSVVIGMTSLLLDSTLDPDQKKFAAKVLKAAEGLNGLARDILDFSKIETGTLTISSQEFNLRETVESVVAMVSEQAKAKGVGLACLIYSELPARLVGDALRLRQVLTQLIGNAVKFTAKGEVVVRLQEARQDDSTIWVTCRISDTGLGIDEEAQKHLFEVFRQGDGSRTRKFGGTGLGLAMAKRLVELMGGDIGFESRLNEGSTFHFTLPFRKKSQAGPMVDVALPWTRGRVLVVDDNYTARQLLRQPLSSWAVAAEEASSGEDALSILLREHRAGRPFDVVIADMHLPDMDAVELVRRAAQDGALQGLRVVALVESGASLDEATAASLGLAGWIVKPVTPEALLERLSLLIEPRKTNPDRRRAA